MIVYLAGAYSKEMLLAEQDDPSVRDGNLTVEASPQAIGVYDDLQKAIRETRDEIKRMLDEEHGDDPVEFLINWGSMQYPSRGFPNLVMEARTPTHELLAAGVIQQRTVE